MKTLYLVRHAKSSWKFPELDDIERPLNKRGNRDAPVMGRFLKDRNILPDILISSPATRAKKTAKIIADTLSYPKDQIKLDEEIYEAGATHLLKITNGINDKCKSAMLVGHNPGMTYFANMLANIRIENIPTCGIACIELKLDSWKDITENSGTLTFFEFPKNLTSS